MRWPAFSLCFALAACSSASDEQPTSGDTLGDGQGGQGGTSQPGSAGNALQAPSGQTDAGSSARAGSPDAGGAGGSPAVGSSGAAGVGGRGGAGGQGASTLSDGGITAPNCGAAPTPKGTPPTLTPGTWTNLTPAGLPFGTSIVVFMQGMALDPCNPFVIYLAVEGYDVGPSKSGLYKSEDGGATWKKVGNLDMPIRIRVDPSDTQHLYACDGVRGGTMGFWVSRDAGDSWEMPAGFKSWADAQGSYDVYDVAFDPSDVKHVLLSFHSGWRAGNAGVAESTDGGMTWKGHDVPGAGYAGMSIAFLRDSKTWLLGTQSNGFWRTKDSGGTWMQVSMESITHGGGNIYYAKSGLYASAYNQNIRSTDNGLTWKTVGPGGGYNAIIGDGDRLFSLKRFGPAPFITSKEDDGLTWGDFSSQEFDQGAFEMAVDRAHGIVYSASWGAGFWALKLQ